MHEIALAEGILVIALEASSGKKIEHVRLRIGGLQHITRESLQFAFDLLAEETPAKGATIHLREIPARFRCKKCSREFPYNGGVLICSHCTGVDLEVLEGEEILVDSVELAGGTIIRNPASELEEEMKKHLIEEHGNH
jgi:hydrogenase nickel incorporation protein HypA/HybF